MSWGPNSACAARRARRPARRRRRAGRRQRPRRALGRPVGAGLSGRPLAARQCPDHAPGRRHLIVLGGGRHPHLPRPGHLLAERRGPGRRAHARRRTTAAAPASAPCAAPASSRTSPTIWHVDVTQSGTFCLASTSNVMLWRPDASVPVDAHHHRPRRAPRTLQLGGRAGRPWPGRRPADRQRRAYSFTQSGVAVPTKITFRTLAREPADLEGGRRRADRERLPGPARRAGREPAASCRRPAEPLSPRAIGA